MKKLFASILIFAFYFFLFSCGNSKEEKLAENKSDSFHLSAKIETLNFKTAYLTVYEGGEFKKLDSSVISNGSFSFKGNVTSPKMAYVVFDDNREDLIQLFLENSAISLSGVNIDHDNLKISGSKLNDDMETFNSKDQKYEMNLRSINHVYDSLKKAGKEDALAAIDKQYDEQDSLRGIFVADYISSNTNSVATCYILMSNYYRFDLDKLGKFYNAFSNEVKNSDYGKQIETKIKVLTSVKIGQPAPQFIMSDTNGNPVTLESFKGNYVMVDFWASWCSPCRAENPNVVKAYNQYHAKGFQILGVSLDKTKSKWTAAIQKDKLMWTHVSDLEGWGNAAAKLYAVSSIPHSVLIDKNGIIIANDLRGEELQKKLAEIYGK